MHVSYKAFLRSTAVFGLCALLLVVMTACGDDDPVNGMDDPEGELAVSVTSIDFGEVDEGESASEDFTIENTGDADLEGSVALAAGSDNFEITSGEGSFNLSAGASQTITVTYTPSSVDPHDGTVSISHDGSNQSPVDVALEGEGIGIPGPPDRPQD